MIFGPNKLYNWYLDLMCEGHGGWFFCVLITTGIFLGISLLLAVCNASVLTEYIWAGIVFGFNLFCIINIQYRIYRDEVNSTFDELKRNHNRYDF